MKLFNGHLLAACAATLVLFGSCKKDDEEKGVKYQIDNTRSTTEWRGYLETGYFNKGTISVQSSDFRVLDGKIKGGTFVMPLNSLVNTNLPDETTKQQLLNHLKSHEIFNMLVYPEFVFKIKSLEPYTGNDETAVQGANTLVTGDLKMMGIYKPISFPARISVAADTVGVAAKVLVDRTRWGINYATSDTLAPADRIKNNLEFSFNLFAKAQ